MAWREPGGVGSGRGRVDAPAFSVSGYPAAEGLGALEHGDPADRLAEVVAAGADRLRDADAEAVDEGGHLLEPGAGGGEAADRAAPHDIREGERHAVDDRGAAVGAHDDQTVLARELLQRHLVLEFHVVA